MPPIFARRHALLPSVALLLLVTGCTSTPPPLPPSPVKPAQIPALPAGARQTAEPLCLPICSLKWIYWVEKWRERLTNPEMLAPTVKPPTKP